MKRIAQRIGQVLIAALFAASIGNLVAFAVRSRQWPLFPTTGLSQSIDTVEPLRRTFDGIGIDHAGYFTEDRTSDDGLLQFLVLQYAVVPVVLRRDASDEPYILINNWRTGELPDAPGMTLVEDFGNGLALYRR